MSNYITNWRGEILPGPSQPGKRSASMPRRLMAGYCAADDCDWCSVDPGEILVDCNRSCLLFLLSFPLCARCFLCRRGFLGVGHGRGRSHTMSTLDSLRFEWGVGREIFIAKQVRIYHIRGEHDRMRSRKRIRRRRAECRECKRLGLILHDWARIVPKYGAFSPI